MRKALKARCIIFANNKPLYDHAIIVNDNIIEEIIPNAEVSTKKNKIINLSNSILMPGLINAHIHLELEWVKRNLLPFSSFASWLEQIIDLKKGMNQEKVILESVRSSIENSIDTGVTTIGQISSYDGLDLKNIIKSKIRTVYFFEITNSTIMRTTTKTFKRLLLMNKKGKDAMFNLRLFPHSIYSLDTRKLREIFKIAKEKELGLGIHLAESIDEFKLSKGKQNDIEKLVFPLLSRKPKINTQNSSPLSYLSRINKDNLFVSLVHMNNLTNSDLELLKKRKYPVILCPRSNLFLNQKLPNLKFFMNYEKAGLGTDGLSSNFSINLMDEIRFLYLNSKKIVKQDCEVRVLEKATIGGARALGIDNYVGSLEAGKRADIIGFKQINLNPYMSVINSNQDDLTFSMINGKVVRLK